MHHFGKFDETALIMPPAHAGHSQAYTQAILIDHTVGSVHSGLSICQLAADGMLAPHCHSFEESFYILAGEALLSLNEQSYQLGPGDFGVAKVGQMHAWRNAGTAPVRWLQMAAPQPKPPGQERDTFFLKGGTAPTQAEPLDLNHLNGNLLGHFGLEQIPPPGDEQRATAGAPPGVFLKWLIDEKLGAIHQRLLFIEYLPGVKLGLHDHTFEETYLILSGEVEATLDGQTYLARPGNVLWTSVGCTHGFANVGDQPVRWLETFSPQPPRENVFRFTAEWEKRAQALEA